MKFDDICAYRKTYSMLFRDESIQSKLSLNIKCTQIKTWWRTCFVEWACCQLVIRFWTGNQIFFSSNFKIPIFSSNSEVLNKTTFPNSFKNISFTFGTNFRFSLWWVKYVDENVNGCLWFRLVEKKRKSVRFTFDLEKNAHFFFFWRHSK